MGDSENKPLTVEGVIFEDNDPKSEANLMKFGELKALFTKNYNIDTADDFADMCDSIKERFPDYENYAVYHALSGSSEIKKFTKFDFPNHEGENFLRELESNRLKQAGISAA